jgi:hypothetical protein
MAWPGEETAMKLLAIGWTVGWVIAGMYIAVKQGRSLTRAACESLLFGPFALLLLLLRRKHN